MHPLRRGYWFVSDLLLDLVIPAVVLALLFALAIGIYSIWPGDDDQDHNRLVSATTYMKAAGFDPGKPYVVANKREALASADIPSCNWHGRDLFNAGAVDNQTAPAWEITINIGTQWTGRRLVTTVVPASKVPLNFGNLDRPRVKFVYKRVPLYFDNNWEDLYDVHAGGAKGAVVNCMNGLAPGRLMNIGLREVREIDPANRS